MDYKNKIKRVHVQLAGKNGKQAWLGLPVDTDWLCLVFSTLGIKKAEDLQIKEVLCAFANIKKHLSGARSLYTLNSIAMFLSDMKEQDLQLVCAIAEMDLSQFGKNTLDVLLSVLSDNDNLNCFEVIDAKNETQLGHYWASLDHLHFASKAELTNYGRECMEDGGAFTERGYVRCTYKKPLIMHGSENLPDRLTISALQINPQDVCHDCGAVYTHAADVARQNNELDLYRQNNSLNQCCAQAIDAAIRDSNYKLYHYDLPAAARLALSDFGAERVQWVLAHTVQRMAWDGRFSDNNKEWAKGFDIPEIKFTHFTSETHPAVLNGFINVVRDALLEKELQPAQPGAAPGEYKYYAVNRPIIADAIPKEPKPEKINNFDYQVHVENGDCPAWGSITFAQPLTQNQELEFGLRAASTNPCEKNSVLKSLKKEHSPVTSTKPERDAKKSGPEL